MTDSAADTSNRKWLFARGCAQTTIYCVCRARMKLQIYCRLSIRLVSQELHHARCGQVDHILCGIMKRQKTRMVFQYRGRMSCLSKGSFNHVGNDLATSWSHAVCGRDEASLLTKMVYRRRCRLSCACLLFQANNNSFCLGGCRVGHRPQELLVRVKLW